jgi:FG-GAP-like repeat
MREILRMMRPLSVPTAPRTTLLLALLLSILAPAAHAAAPTAGPLRVGPAGTRFVDAAGRTTWLTGMLVCCEAAQSNGWPWISRPMIDRLAQNGGNWINIRLGPFTRAGELPRFEPYHFVGGHAYDLETWNDAFWTDLHDTVAYARDRGVYAEIDLIDGWVLENPPGEDRTLLSPWKAGNNVNGVADDCSILHDAPSSHHVRWLQKVAATVGDLDNVVFQVGNETGDCQGGGTSVAWEDGVITIVRQALRNGGFGERIFSTNAQTPEVESLSSVDYVNVHPHPDPEHVTLRAGKPTGVNEYPDGDGFGADDYTRELWSAFVRGTFFHYWRGDDDGTTFDTVFSRIGIFRKFLYTTGLARFETEPVGFRVVGAYGREYVGFLPYGGIREIDLGPTLREFRVDWVNPKNGVLSAGTTITASGSYVFEAPAPTAQMWAVHVYATDGCGDCTAPHLSAAPNGYTVTLDWATDLVGVRRYRIERRLQPAGAWEEIELNLPPETQTYQDTVPAPTPSATYSYRVRALYLYGGSAYSNEVAVTLYNALPPAPPTNLSPTGCSALPPHFRWDPAPLANGYYLRARLVGTGEYLINNSSIAGSTYVPDAGELEHLSAHVGETLAWSVKTCNNLGCSSTYSADATIVLRRPVRADFDGDCRSDLLLRSLSTGDLRAWLMDGASRVGETPLTPARPAAGNWSLAGTGDFDDDGQADLLWWNGDSGNLATWFMNGATRVSGATSVGFADLQWRVAATADLDRDRRADVVWRRLDTGALAVRLSTTGALVSLDPPAMSPDFSLAAMGDLSGDGRPDILWRSASTGQLRYWFLDGTRRIAEGVVSSAAVPGFGWRVVGLWNVDQDGRSDIVWQNQFSTALVVWHMNGIQQVSGEYFSPTQSGPDLEAVGPR